MSVIDAYNSGSGGKDLVPGSLHHVEWLDDNGDLWFIAPPSGWEKYGPGFSEELTPIPPDADVRRVLND